MLVTICSNGLAWRLRPCKEWAASRDGGGYGQRKVNGKVTKVHRLALAEKLGRHLLPGMKALHHCDNPPCYEPEHLYEGTSAQNNRDCADRYRWRAAPDRPRISESVKEAVTRRYVVDGLSMAAIGAEFGIGANSVMRIVPREHHRRPGGRGQPQEVIAAICRRYAAGGVSQLTLSKEFGLATGTISRLISNHSAQVLLSGVVRG